MTGFGNKKLILLYAAGVLFVVLILVLGYYNRLAIDDYAYLLEEKTLGIRAATLNTYLTWDTRWVGFLLLNGFLKLYEKTQTLLWFHVFSLFSVIFSIHFVLKQIVKERHIHLPGPIILAFALLFAAGFFFLTPGIGETWFWINSSVTYLWPIVFYFLGLGFMLGSGQGVRFSSFFCFFFFFLTGGSSYELPPLVLISFISFLFYKGHKNSTLLKTFLKSKMNRTICIAIVGCASGFAINYFGPGNSVRQSAEPPESILRAFPVTAVSLLKLVLLDIFPKIPYILFFSVPWIFLGNFLGKGRVKPENSKFGMTVLVSTGLLLVLTVISLFIPAYLLSEMGPKRSLTQISVYLLVWSTFLSVYAGYRLELNQKALIAVFYISVLSCMIILGLAIVSQQAIASSYARALDKRVSYLQGLKEKGNKAWVKLEPLPASGYLYSAEISTDTSHFSNVQFQKSLSLNFKISLK